MALLAICSDSHDNFVNIKKFCAWCQQNEIQTILHCGDWTTSAALSAFRKNFSSAIQGVYGNADSQEKELLKRAADKNIIVQKETLSLTIGSTKIYLAHRADNAPEVALQGQYDMIFYGHNHKPWSEIIGRALVVNPGNLSGMFFRASFAVYNTQTKKLELKILDLIE